MPSTVGLSSGPTAVANKVVTCQARISAVRATDPAMSGKELGGLTELAPGTLLEICGDGYNERTIKVRSGGALFYVFRQDLQL